MVAPHPERNKTEADLSKANFSKSSLRYWNLSKTDLTRANLTGADLRDANLSGARPPIGPVVSQGGRVPECCPDTRRDERLARTWAHSGIRFRKVLPVQDVMRAGGWRDVKALQTAYQSADPETVRRVLDMA